MAIDNKGYLKINDFGISKIYKEKNYKENGGTPGYMSPEVIFGQNYSYTADYFAVGIMGYEFMFGHRPYKGKNKQEVKFDMLSRQIFINLEEKPDDWSNESVDFINKLIERKKEQRLGVNGINEIKEHPWFKHFNWKDLYFYKIESPYIPNGEDNNKIIGNIFKKAGVYEEQSIDKIMKIIGSSQYEKSFKKFYYFNREDFQYKGKLKNIFINPHLSDYEKIVETKNINDKTQNERNKEIKYPMKFFKFFK